MNLSSKQDKDVDLNISDSRSHRSNDTNQHEPNNYPGSNHQESVVPSQCQKHQFQFKFHARTVDTKFWWQPSRCQDRDVAEFCRSCSSCQKTAGRNRVRAPLIPLLMIAQPLERIAMDIVGPLPRSAQGNCYMLVVYDYATRYPEAIPMKHIDAARVAEELMKILARVGVPKEVLTDQGTNFTSQLLTELYKMLHVQPICTTPYHPQTDGLVERFNHTLKRMLRKTIVKEGKDWDKLLPCCHIYYLHTMRYRRLWLHFHPLIFCMVSKFKGHWMSWVRHGRAVEIVKKVSYPTF